MKCKANKENHFEVDYYMGDKSLEAHKAILVKNIFDIKGLSIFNKIFPLTIDPIDSDFYKKQNNPRSPLITFKDQKVTYLKLPSCGIQYKPILDSLLAANHDQITKTPTMIIDIRGNDGGWNSTYQEVIPYLYTHPAISEGASFWVTPDNIDKQIELYKNNIQYFSEEEKIEWEEQIKELSTQMNTHYQYPIDTLQFDTVYPYPSKVAVLIDRRVMSSGEHFVIAAKKSKKVTIFGENTGGVIDYGDVRRHEMPCNKFNFMIPTTRFNWVANSPIDNVGIPPQVRIPAEVADWEDFVLKYFGN